MEDAIIDQLDQITDLVGYELKGFDEQGEFPEGCHAARIIGPMLPLNGLPFIVPAATRELWAKRYCLVLATAFLAGMAKAIQGDMKTPGSVLH